MAEAAHLELPYPETAVVVEDSLTEQNLALAAALPERPVVLGGCCCTHVGAVEGLATRYDRLAVVWFDAHGDLNTPESSPSGNLWGMPFRMLLDSGTVQPADAVLVGARNLDPPEVEFIAASGLRTGVDELDGALDGADAVYVAFDADVLDRCPDHSGKPQGAARVTQGVKRASFEGTGAVVTKALVALNVGIYLLELGMGGNINGTGNRIYIEGVLFGPLVAEGEWWRLFTSMFLHYGPLHLGLNMLVLWWFGSAVEQVLGRGRYLLLYLVSGLAGSAGALLLSPNALTVGASGAIFGIFGAAFVLERQGTYVFGGGALSIIVLNLVFTFAFGFGGGISIGGHLGGLAGGAVGMLALSRFGRGHAVYGRPGLLGVAGLIGVGVISLAVAFWAAQGTLS